MEAASCLQFIVLVIYAIEFEFLMRCLHVGCLWKMGVTRMHDVRRDEDQSTLGHVGSVAHRVVCGLIIGTVNDMWQHSVTFDL